jgi:Rrf2 family transcriptional regulator, cysteine metabolism repressor
LSFTAREEYGLKALMHLTEHMSDWPVQSREIARAEGIPEQFLEQVLAGLRRAGIVRSVRGAAGGYELARRARDITAGDVLRALTGSTSPRRDILDEQSDTVVRDLKQRVQDAVSKVLDGTTVQNLVDERLHRDELASYMMHI